MSINAIAENASKNYYDEYFILSSFIQFPKLFILFHSTSFCIFLHLTYLYRVSFNFLKKLFLFS